MIGKRKPSCIRIHEGDIEIVFLMIGSICIGLRIDKWKTRLGLT